MLEYKLMIIHNAGHNKCNSGKGANRQQPVDPSKLAKALIEIASFLSHQFALSQVPMLSLVLDMPHHCFNKKLLPFERYRVDLYLTMHRSQNKLGHETLFLKIYFTFQV
jgi:hypothetical protein